jgi:hypothetical protein
LSPKQPKETVETTRKDEDDVVEESTNGEPIAKFAKTLPCTVCLGLLEDGIKDDFLNEVRIGVDYLWPIDYRLVF